MDINASLDSIILYVRQNEMIKEAAKEDILVAKDYYGWHDKGLIVNDRRVTILSKKNKYKVNEEIRIIHSMEILKPGHLIYIMGPKPVYDEYINDIIQRMSDNNEYDNQFKPINYNGRVLQSPGVDFNFEITSYSFDKPGIFRIIWQPGKLKSNVLTIQVE